MNHANNDKEADAINSFPSLTASGKYRFGLPDVEPTAKLTCAFCGAPAISEIELFDEVICDLCYEKYDHIREEADNQYCYDKGCGIQTDPDRERDQGLGCCDGKCARCVL